MQRTACKSLCKSQELLTANTSGWSGHLGSVPVVNWPIPLTLMQSVFHIVPSQVTETFPTLVCVNERPMKAFKLLVCLLQAFSLHLKTSSHMTNPISCKSSPPEAWQSSIHAPEEQGIETCFASTLDIKRN